MVFRLKVLVLGSWMKHSQYLFVLSRSTSVSLRSGLAGSTPYAPLDVHGRTSVWTLELGQNADSYTPPSEHWNWDRMLIVTHLHLNTGTGTECWQLHTSVWTLELGQNADSYTPLSEHWNWDRMPTVTHLRLNTGTGTECRQLHTSVWTLTVEQHKVTIIKIEQS